MSYCVCNIYNFKRIKKCTADAPKAVTKELSVRMLEKLQAVLVFHRNLMCANIYLLLVSMQPRCEEQTPARPKAPFSNI